MIGGRNRRGEREGQQGKDGKDRKMIGRNIGGLQWRKSYRKGEYRERVEWIETRSYKLHKLYVNRRGLKRNFDNPYPERNRTKEE